MGADWVLSVSQLNEYARRLLASDAILAHVVVQGELSGFKRHISGHLYFTLKDEQARIACVMFRQSAQGLAFEPRDGMRVTARGAVSLFVRDGAYQLYVERMEQEGVGDLYRRFEELKARLTREGLFDAALKREIPACPKTLGVVTARGGAVLRDIVRVARRRDPQISVILASAAVQGQGAAGEIAAAIARLNADGRADVILCGRGGGSIEDLWAFNEEAVARAIRASRIPVISCVGHETDFTIADFAADVRAATPSAAAEMAVPLRAALIEAIGGARARLTRSLEGALREKRERLSGIARSPAFSMPVKLFIGGRRDRLKELEARRDAALSKRAEAARRELSSCERALAALSPEAVLGRGYAVVYKEGKVAPRVGALEAGNDISIRFADGRASATVTAALKTVEDGE